MAHFRRDPTGLPIRIWPPTKLSRIRSYPVRSVALQQRRSSGSESRSGFWLLAALLVIAATAVAFQTSRVDVLSGQVESLQTELSTTRAALHSYESRFDEIHASVAELRSQLTELETLVEERPTATP